MSASASARAGGGVRLEAAPTTRALTASESAWLIAPPCALALIVAIVLAGPPLGRTLLQPPADVTIWPSFYGEGIVQLEDAEHARYLIALLGPLLVSGGAALLNGRRLRAAVIEPLTRLAQVLLLALVVVGVVAQERHVYGPLYVAEQPATTMVLLTPATLAFAALFAAFSTLALRSRPLVSRLARALHETPAKRAVAMAVAALVVLSWLLSAFNTDGSIELANGSIAANIPFWTDEAFSILNGQAPLVGFNAQYGHLWAYAAAGWMTLFGASIGAYSVLMLAGTAGAMAAIYAVLRRLTGSSVASLALFLPFVATSFFMQVGPLENRYGPANLFSLFPIRYAGPYVLLWLMVRRVQRGSARPPVALSAVAGLVAINNLEFGVPAFAATMLALAATSPDRSLAALARLAASAVAGVSLAVGAVALLTLAVAGSLPHFEMLLTFPRIYGSGGFGMLPMPTLGLHLAVYTTFAAAIVVAAVRLLSADRDAPLTAALAWAGVFGLGAGGYFVGRSHPHVLVDLFSAWALALSLLTLVVVPAILRRISRRPQLAELLVLAGVGAALCSLAQVPTPWSQIDRIASEPHAERVDDSVLKVVDRLTHRGEPVALMLPLGHRIAYQLGLENVTPYANMDSMITVEQWRETVEALQRAHGHRLIVPEPLMFAERQRLLEAAGYVPQRHSPTGVGMIEYVDATARRVR